VLIIESETPKPVRTPCRSTVLQLSVKNHAGVMSHICGLFARRAYNLEGIIVMPVGDGKRSLIWLMVKEDQRLDQVVKQVMKLEDVIEVKSQGIDKGAFTQLEAFFTQADAAPSQI
jgi:acetolactate synthase I/III small subunit